MDQQNPTSRLVSVYGSGIGKPLLRSNEARLIQIRDVSGDLMALMVRIKGDTWIFSANGDSDWEEHKRRLEINDSES